MHDKGFPPIADAHARILILGSLPGQVSIRRQQYYAHPQNAFWKVMGRLFDAGPELPYRDRAQRLLRNGIALWDVCAAAQRPGSLDTSIVHSSVVPTKGRPIRYVTLPSTSPAHAAMPFEEKLTRWAEVLQN
jgi:TDG/mug DNA glycosylase family protein